ncbi:ABC transporter ATP-binding protein [Endozoicomonas sp. SM1973]|uniref:ABC transporter ATP-binding protein n=1 Tax=Spartinivicinus marinus TaxID=2994442 RepID=A0A853ILM9_9GAMM|nr:ABC transporter ATP-binding protein [Spartinivicinus marinus]MCX4025840.1 ABC transporter ATP-binding protein [Spartinivicinus marinus]NYZ68656.1 ABC transporter ATP-binding protein [Spartinivicinus marinus]
MSTIRLKNISKAYNRISVMDNIELTIDEGEFVAFVGPSGCGKSTLLRMIAGLEQQTTGSILIDNKDVSHLPPAKRGIGMVFQTYALYPHLTVFNNMALALKQAKLSKLDIQQRVDDAAKVLRLEQYLKRKPAELSGGQRQRVAIGRAMVRKPKVFLLDEPLSNLDAALRTEVRLELAKLHRQLSSTMIYVTHDQVEAMTLADRIVVLNEGKIEQVGDPLTLYHHPDNQFVAEFIGSPKINLLPAELSTSGQQITLSSGLFKSINWPWQPNTTATKVKLGIRPEDIEVTTDHNNAAMVGKIIMKESLGSDSYIYVSLSHDYNMVVRVTADQPCFVGQSIGLILNLSRSHLFAENGRSLKTPAQEQLKQTISVKKGIAAKDEPAQIA